MSEWIATCVCQTITEAVEGLTNGASLGIEAFSITGLSIGEQKRK